MTSTSHTARVAMDGVVPWPAQIAQRYRELGVWTGQRLFDVLATSSARMPTQIALVDARRRLSYAALSERVAGLAAGLRELGIGAGDAVILQLPNCCELVEAFFALSQLGARPVMALPAHRERELSHMASQTGAVAHVTCEVRAGFDYRTLASRLRDRVPTLRHTLVVGEPGVFVALDSLYRPGQQVDSAHVQASDVALFQLSGGTTNLPKLIARTHDDYLYSVRCSVEVCQLDASTSYLAALPAGHNFPLSSPGMLGTLLAGGKIVLAELAAPDQAFALIEREQVTVAALVPALVPAWLTHAARARAQLVSLRLLQVGGAKLHEGLARRIAPELGCRLQQVFGMAEGLVCYTRSDDPLELVVASQGRPMSTLDELRVVDDDDRDVQPGVVGNLLVRGPYTIRGYYRAPEHNVTSFTSDGYYRTGDRVRRLPDGSLVVEGRSKEQINRGGEKIAAPEVEEALCTHPAVVSAAVVPMQDAYLGERSCAFVVLRDPVKVQVLRTHLREAGLATYKIPDRIEVLKALPLTAIGKVDKKALARSASGQA